MKLLSRYWAKIQVVSLGISLLHNDCVFSCSRLASAGDELVNPALFALGRGKKKKTGNSTRENPGAATANVYGIALSLIVSCVLPHSEANLPWPN